ncbi:15485_t:CDS:2, partial [Gigaspora rosea]
MRDMCNQKDAYPLPQIDDLLEVFTGKSTYPELLPEDYMKIVVFECQ